MRLSVIVGTRPEAIKLAPVIREAKKRDHKVTVILTGQHRDMALPLLNFFKVSADINLDVMTANQTLSSLTSRVMSALDQNREAVSADIVMVQGDTTSAFAAAYWAFCNQIPVAHLEAGLRTYNLKAPFPEEANRQLIGRIADLHFAPTKSAALALKKEGVAARKILTVGNTSIDALNYTLEHLDDETAPESERLDPIVREYTRDKDFILVTAHRRENFGEGLENVCDAILSILKRNQTINFVYPVHPNPNVREVVERRLGNHPRILLCKPIPYIGFVSLMQKAKLLLTDSGGVQEEGPTLRKPILVMRSETERPEGIRSRFSKLVGTDSRKIEREAILALKKGCVGRGKNPYGDGKTSIRVVRSLEKFLA